jgi:hypothetical protein
LKPPPVGESVVPVETSPLELPPVAVPVEVGAPLLLELLLPGPTLVSVAAEFADAEKESDMPPAESPQATRQVDATVNTHKRGAFRISAR